MRAFLYEPDPPLDVAQADALDLIVSHAPVRMGDVASLLHVDPSTATPVSYTHLLGAAGYDDVLVDADDTLVHLGLLTASV